MTICTTLDRIRACGPCGIDPRDVLLTGYQKLKAHLGPDWGAYDPIPFSTIVESNGLDDALWCLRSIDFERASRLFAVWCTRRVQHLMADQRSLDALDVAQRFVLGKATREELNAALAAAWVAVGEAAAAFGAAARAAWAAAAAAAAAAEWAARAAAREAREAAAGVEWVAVEEDAQRAMFLRVVACETEQEAIDLLLAEMPKRDSK